METIGSILTLRDAIKNIKGISFTPREIDVVACLMNGRNSDKEIAILLSISPKTVETHIQNLKSKIGCNSRRMIVDFFEASQNHLMIKEHYSFVLETHYFSSTLKNTTDLTVFTDVHIPIVYERALPKEKTILIEVIQEALEIAKIKTSKKSLKEQFSHTNNAMYVITSEDEEKNIRTHLQDEKLNPILLCFNFSFDIATKKADYHYIFINYNSSFYIMMFDILFMITSSSSIMKVSPTIKN